MSHRGSQRDPPKDPLGGHKRSKGPLRSIDPPRSPRAQVTSGPTSPTGAPTPGGSPRGPPRSPKGTPRDPPGITQRIPRGIPWDGKGFEGFTAGMLVSHFSEYRGQTIKERGQKVSSLPVGATHDDVTWCAGVGGHVIAATSRARRPGYQKRCFLLPAAQKVLPSLILELCCLPAHERFASNI